MGNCASTLDCNAEEYLSSNPEPLEVDPDIAGPGVLASFIISGALTILVIFFGYFTDSLPRRHLHKIDRVFIRQTRESWIFAKCLPAIAHVLRPAKHALKRSKMFRLHVMHVPREIRVEALLRFLLVNSDQQLVTGLAVLVGGLARRFVHYWQPLQRYCDRRLTASRCTLTGYECQITTSLGWFSTVTHLATLTVLTNYFRDHPEVLLLRLIGMWATLVLLCFSLVVSQLRASPLRAPVQCAIYNLKSEGGQIAVLVVLLFYIVGSFIARIVALGTEMQTSKENTNKLQANLQAIAHQNSNDNKGSRSEAIQLPFPDETVEIAHDPFEELGFINSQAKIVLTLHARLSKNLPRNDDFKRILPIAVESVETQRIAYFESEASTEKRRSWVFYADLLSIDYCNSFAFGFSIIVFAFSFAIAQTIQSRSSKGIPLAQGVREWGFGQIVPLFLLGLPLLSAAEIYFESRRKVHSHWYALAIADGSEAEKKDGGSQEDQTGELGHLPDLERRDTITPKHYRTFVDTPAVKYGLRIGILLSNILLAYAGAGMEASGVKGMWSTAVAIIVSVSLFSLYATFREVFLVSRRMKQISTAESIGGAAGQGTYAEPKLMDEGRPPMSTEASGCQEDGV